MAFAFYAIPLADRIGFQWEFVLLACMGSILAFIPIMVLMWKGEEVREKLGRPKNINSIDQTDDRNSVCGKEFEKK